MAKEKSLVEEAIIQMKNLEEAVAENAKGILASTMSQEIKELVKESLTEQDEDEIETDIDVEEPEGSEDIADIEFGDESDEEGDETDNIDLGIGDDDEFEDEDEDEDEDDEDTIDLTDVEDDEEILRVFQLMGPDDNIVVTKDDKGNTHLKDEETGKEYMIVGEGEEEEYEEMYEGDDMYGEDDMYEGNHMYEEDEMYDEMEEEESIESIVERMFGSDDKELEEEDDLYGMDEEIVYEIEMSEEEDQEEMGEEVDEESIYESKSTIKPKGVGMGKPKFKYSSNPNQGKGFDTKMKQGPKTMGTGKAKFDYKEGENAGDKLGKNKIVKKTETKEASRTLGAGSKFRKGGLPKPKAHSSFNTAIKESATNKEVQILREKNEEYRKALNIFRNKLNEVAVFNSNLAYATRLFTEHSTSKQEKINILRRFDGVETIKESKNLYQTLKSELSSGTKSQPVNESIESKIAKAPSTGSAVNLIESKTYENPQFLRMKDLMAKLK